MDKSQEAGAVSPELLWTPSQDKIAASGLWAYMKWLKNHRGIEFDSYEDLWAWSTSDLDSFWRSIWDYFDVQADGASEPVLRSSAMPGAQWFPNSRLNYAEHVFRNVTGTSPAIIARNETGGVREVSWAELKRDTAALAARMRALGITPGDRVASYLPNGPETVIAFLACASVGAIWSSCSPEMGRTMVLDRSAKSNRSFCLRWTATVTTASSMTAPASSRN